MATTEEDEPTVEYVELLDVPVYEEEDQEIVTIQSESNELTQVIDDTSQMEEVEYIEAEEIDGEHTIIVHEGKQYVIPTEQLQQIGNTIVLEDGEETEYVEAQNDENIYYTEVDSEETNLTGQYAVIKDGKLHIQESSDSEELQQKLRVLENTLNSYEEDEEEDPLEEEDEEAPQEDDENDALSQITGKNLITGQTISLSGFLDKIRRKGIGDVTSEPSLRRGSSKVHTLPLPSSDYVLVPPVNRRVVVGRTPDGRRLVGKILQIQKKIPPSGVLPPMQKRYAQRQPRAPRRHLPQPQSSGLGAPIPQCSALLDANVSRTLAGLMDLESVARSLAGRRLVVRHVTRQPGARRLAYYSGRMARGEPNNDWQFRPDPPAVPCNGIDLREGGDPRQLQLKLDYDGLVFNAEEDLATDEEPITLYLTVTQDEFGKKRTKVSIPQLGGTGGVAKRSGAQKSEEAKSDVVGSGGHVCSTCGKKFQSVGSLRRHASVHDPSLRPLQCLTCPARFTDVSSLKKHLVLHSGVRPHVCAVCQRSFAHRGDLNFHARTHDPVKRFRCEVCSKQFHRHSNMLRHADIHRQATSNTAPSNAAPSNDDTAAASPPFTCHTCGCQYNFISSLTRHIVNNHMATTGPVDGAT